MDCIYDRLCRNPNFKEKYKMSSKSKFQPICELMDFFKQYYVPDLIGSECKVLFILESPHTDEIIHKHPLAGSSGLNLSKGLIDAGLNEIANANGNYLPFGCWLQENINTSIGKKFGIMNVCNFPMQSEAYSCGKEIYVKDSLERLRTLINTPSTNKEKELFNVNYILNHLSQPYDNVNARQKFKEDFKIVSEALLIKIPKLKKIDKRHIAKIKQIQNIINKQNIAIVFCGKVSFYLIYPYLNNIKSENLLYIPHPSNKSWNNDSTITNKFDSLKKIVDSLAIIKD